MSKPKNMTPEQEDARRAKQREYDAKPEVKARRREYTAKPEVKARRREYTAKPEVKAKQREYMAEYDAKPEVKARQRERKAETRNQAAADQFFIMAGAVESLTNLITQTKKTA